MEKRWKLSVEVSPNCPRCGSSNTKFCYYNIYSLTQPRYFCKGCRRYWTKGGSLRNVPVGGGCRKNRRVKYLRLPTGCVPSKNLSCGVVPTEPTRHGSNGCNTSDGSHIDLTLVYANYLNQPPGNKPGFEYDPPSHEHFSSLSNTNFDSRILQPEENGLIGCLNHSTENHICYSGLLESVHKHQDGVQHLQTSHETTSNYELSQFPGDVLSSQDFLWSNSDSPTSHALETSPETVLGEAVEDSNPWFGNWSPFDFVL